MTVENSKSAALDISVVLAAHDLPPAEALATLAAIVSGMCITAANSRENASEIFDAFSAGTKQMMNEHMDQRPDMIGAGWAVPG